MERIHKMRPVSESFDMDDLLPEETPETDEDKILNRPDGEEDPEDLKASAEAEDLYQIYMEELIVIKDLEDDEIDALFIKKNNGDPAARERLIEGNLKKVLFYVKDFVNQGVPMSDLIQEASVELMMLVDEAENRGFLELLESRVCHRLQEVVEEQKADTDFNEEYAERVNVLEEVASKLAEELGHQATEEEIANRMNLPLDEVKDLMKVSMDALGINQ